MKLIGIDTSSHLGSVSVTEDRRLLGECLLNLGPMHSENITSSIDWLLKTLDVKKDELQGVAVSVGPGSFTSLRVGVVTAKSLAYALGLKIIGVSSLESLASNVPFTDKKICTLVDAKRKEVYSSIFQYHNGTIRQIRDEEIQKVEDLCKSLNESTVFIGDAAANYKDVLIRHLGDLAVVVNGESFNNPKSSHCAFIGYDKLKEGIEDDPMELVPNYLRRSDAQIELNNQ